MFGRKAGTVPGYAYSKTLKDADFVWTAETIDRLFAEGPEHFVPGSKMPLGLLPHFGGPPVQLTHQDDVVSAFLSISIQRWQVIRDNYRGDRTAVELPAFVH